jgi:hypothetical protein
MLCEDVKVVPLRNSILCQDGVVDSATERLQFRGGAPFIDVNADKRHVDLLRLFVLTY